MGSKSGLGARTLGDYFAPTYTFHDVPALGLRWVLVGGEERLVRRQVQLSVPGQSDNDHFLIIASEDVIDRGGKRMG